MTSILITACRCHLLSSWNFTKSRQDVIKSAKLCLTSHYIKYIENCFSIGCLVLAISVFSTKGVKVAVLRSKP